MKNLYKLRYACTVSIALVFTAALVAQTQPRSGTVRDAQGPLAGVHVLVKNSNRGTSTHLDGTYTLRANPSDSLVFSFVGYLPKTLAVGQQTTLNVTMVQDATSLDQVVLNAGYYRVTQREKTGSIAKVTAQEIENQPVTNPLAAIQGRMPGVNVIQNTGVPGGGFSIRIRGRNSIRDTGNDPLYIVDGVPFAAQSLGDYTVSSVLGAAQSPLNTIDPNNIQSIEVLKDADATAIYGSRGANGVVLITTKKGTEGKTTVTINTSTGVGNLTRKIKLLNTKQYLAMREEAFANDGVTEYPYNAYDINGTWDRNRYTDWQETLIGNTAYYHNTRFTVSAGTEKTRFVLGGSHQKQTTVFPGNYKYKKNTALLNIDHTSHNNKLQISFSGTYGVDRNKLPPVNLVREALVLPPNAPALYNEDGSLNWEDGTFNNPLAPLQGEYRSHTNALIANSVITYSPFKNLTLKANLGYVNNVLDETKTSPHTIYNPAFGLDSSFSSVVLNTGDRTSWLVEPQIDYKFKKYKAQFNVLLGSTFQKQTTTQLGLFASDFPSNNLIYNPAAAATVAVNKNTEEIYKYQAGFARLNINWDHKYILNLTGRRDGSSRFGPGNQYANFGAIGAAWLFSNEPFIKDALSFISFGKLRGSYGTTGNDQIGNYGFLDTYSPSGFSYQGMQGLVPVQLYNPNYQWESNKKWETALEVSFLKDRIAVKSSYYNNQSSNQLVGIPLPGTTGFTSLQDNLDATVQNTGWEIGLTALPFQSNKFTWELGFNITIPKNKLVSFPGLETSSYANLYKIGHPLNIRLLYKATGVDPQTGVYTFLDVDGDGQITAPNDRTAIADLSPKYYGGVNSSWSFGNFKADILLQFVKQLGSSYKTAFSLPGFMENQPAEILDHWQQPGDQSNNQLYSTGFNSQAYTAYNTLYNSTAGISDASYVRVKNIALSYVIPKKWNLGLTCKVYLQAQNLFTFTNYKGPDPETQINNNLPPLKVINTGVQLTF